MNAPKRLLLDAQGRRIDDMERISLRVRPMGQDISRFSDGVQIEACVKSASEGDPMIIGSANLVELGWDIYHTSELQAFMDGAKQGSLPARTARTFSSFRRTRRCNVKDSRRRFGRYAIL